MRRMGGSWRALPRSVLRVDEFLGLDLIHANTDRSPKRSPDGVNMIRDVPGKLRKRMGYFEKAEFSARINGLHLLQDGAEKRLLVHAGTGLFEGETQLYSDMADARSQSFSLGGKLFLLDGKQLLCFDGETVVPAKQQAYVPTLTIGRLPAGGGTAYEALNLLGGRFRDSFCADGSSTLFQLSYTGLDEGEVTVELMDEDGGKTQLASGAFSVNRTLGQVQFVSPPAAAVQQKDNVVITASKQFAGNCAMIDGCRFGILYGVGGEPNRLFVSGNAAYPNRDWHSELNNGLYFPQDGYSVLGLDSAVTAYSMSGNFLAAHKRAERDGRNIILRSGVMEEGRAAFPIVNILQGPGTLAAASVAYPADEPLFFTDSGVMAITTSDIKGERYAQSRSYFIGSALAAEQTPEEAQAAAYRGFYLLALNGRCYLLDTLQKTAEAGAPYSAHQFEAYLFDNIPARVLACLDGKLLFGTADGRVMQFYDDPEDPDSYQDDGAAIAAHWDLDFSGSRFEAGKRLCSISLRMAPFANSSFSVLARKQGVWQPLFGESQKTRRLCFDSVDFGNFSFSCDPNPISLGRRVKLGVFDAIRLRLENQALREPMGLYELALEFTETGRFRR